VNIATNCSEDNNKIECAAVEHAVASLVSVYLCICLKSCGSVSESVCLSERERKVFVQERPLKLRRVEGDEKLTFRKNAGKFCTQTPALESDPCAEWWNAGAYQTHELLHITQHARKGVCGNFTHVVLKGNKERVL